MNTVKKISENCYLVSNNADCYLTEEPTTNPELGCRLIQVSENSWNQRKGIWFTTNGTPKIISLPDTAITALTDVDGNKLFYLPSGEKDFSNQTAKISFIYFDEIFN
jgi:hypothetical protein